MIGRRTLGTFFLLVLTMLSLTGCREAALRYNTRFMTLLQEPMPRTLPIPVDGVMAAQLQDNWGQARYGGRRHEGIDISQPAIRPSAASPKVSSRTRVCAASAARW